MALWWFVLAVASSGALNRNLEPYLSEGASISAGLLVLGMVSVFFLPPVVMGFIALFGWREERMREQEERDREAQRVADEIERQVSSEDVSAANIPPFALYLRPFAIENAIRKRGNEIGIVPTLLVGKMGFDHYLQPYFSSLGMPLISIVPTYAPLGAGHLFTSDSSWRDRFRMLAPRAKTIVVVPGIQPGIVAEIRWLMVSGLLGNAVFFKPKGYPKAEWEKMKRLYEEDEGIELPDYSPKQLSFRMYSSGICHGLLEWRTTFLTGDRVRGEKQMRAILNNGRVDSD